VSRTVSCPPCSYPVAVFLFSTLSTKFVIQALLSFVGSFLLVSMINYFSLSRNEKKLRPPLQVRVPRVDQVHASPCLPPPPPPAAPLPSLKCRQVVVSQQTHNTYTQELLLLLYEDERNQLNSSALL
jgi:hypothetical protein